MNVSTSRIRTLGIILPMAGGVSLIISALETIKFYHLHKLKDFA